MPERCRPSCTYKAETTPRDASFTSPIRVMEAASNLALLAALVPLVFAAPQGLGVQYVDVNSGPQLPSVWLCWRKSQVS